MKKSKLLTSLSALALVLSLGACSEPEEETKNPENPDEGFYVEGEDEDSSSSTSESSGGDTEEPSEEYDGDPVKDLLETVKEENNYHLRIEYQDYRSSTYGDAQEMYSDFWAGTLTQNFVYDYIVDLTYTEDVFLLEYYLNGDDLSITDPADIEVYVNTETGLDVYYLTQYTTNTIYVYDTYPNTTWQEYFPNLLDLGDYLEYINVDSDSYDMVKVDYTITVETLDFLTILVDRLYRCGNYYPDYEPTQSAAPFVVNYKSYWETSGAPYINSTYLFELEEWDTTMFYLEDIGTGSDHQLYYFGASSYVYDVGSASIPEVYTSQFN